MKKTFRDYIEFLRKNKFLKEADFYENEVTKILMDMGFSLETIFNMAPKNVVANVVRYYNLLMNILGKTNVENWDVEIYG